MKGERNGKAFKLGYVRFYVDVYARVDGENSEMLFGWQGHEIKGNGTVGRCVLTS